LLAKLFKARIREQARSYDMAGSFGWRPRAGDPRAVPASLRSANGGLHPPYDL